MKQVTINLYSFSELNEKARQRAINEHQSFMTNEGQEYEDDNGEMQIDYPEWEEDDVIENIEANEYVFFEDGELASVTHYCGKHPQAGTTELKFHGRTYDITK